MSQDEYIKLFNYLAAEFDEMHTQFDQLATKLELNCLTIKIKTAAIQAARMKLAA